MNIDATPETIRATAAVLGKARLLDDKIGSPDQARIAAWAEQIEPHKLGQRDLMKAVGAFYMDNVAGRTMQVGDLIFHARQIRRERAEREPDEFREARQAALEAKVAAEADEKSCSTVALRYARPEGNPLMIRCPHCNARPGSRCSVPGTTRPPHGGMHPARLEAARRPDDTETTSRRA